MGKKTIKQTDDKVLHIGVNEDSRAKVAEALSSFLATTYSLYLQSLYYHWNVTGDKFISLHALFEEQYNSLHNAGDALAERIRALGHFCPGSMKEFAKLSAIEEDESLPKNATKMIENLLKNNEIASQQARKVLHIAEAAEDEVTVDMMVERMQSHDKAAWMLRSLLQ